MRTLRRVVFYVFLAAYVLGAPAMILYAFGFWFRPGEAGALQRTGLIVIETAPPGAQVFLGGRRYARRTPTVIRHIAPGEYALRLARPDYQPWEAAVVVEKEKAVVLDHILLAPTMPAFRLCDTNRFEELDPGPAPDHLLLSRGTRAGDLWAWSMSEDRARPLLAAGHPLEGARVERRFVEEGGAQVVLHLVSRDGPAYLRVDLDDDTADPEDLTPMFPVDPGDIAWDPREPDMLFALVGARVNRIDLDRRAIYPAILDGIRSLAIRRDRVYATTVSNTFIRARADGTDLEDAGPAPARHRSLWRAPEAVRVLPVDAGTSLFLDATGGLFANIEPFVLSEPRVLGVSPGVTDDSRIVWDAHRVGRIDFTSGVFTTNRPQARVEWFHESERAFAQAFPVYDGSHLLLVGDGRADLVPLAPAGSGPARPLTAIARDTLAAYVEDEGLLYFLAPETRRLVELRVIPERGLLPVRPREPDPRAEERP